MINLIRDSLESRDTDGDNSADDWRFLFVEFNAWLYQGYDDVRAALMEIIANAIKDEADERKTAVDKAGELLRRVNWVRVAKLTAGTAGALAFA